MRVFTVSQYPAAKRGNQPENAMTEEEAKKKQLLAAYAWGRHSAAAPECFALDPDKLVALCALGVMPPKVEQGAGSTPATGSAGNGVSVGEQPAAACVDSTSSTTGAEEQWDALEDVLRQRNAAIESERMLLAALQGVIDYALDRVEEVEHDRDAEPGALESARASLEAADAAIAHAEGRAA